MEHEQPVEKTFLVTYDIHVEALSAHEAAKKVADLLSDPDVPQRGSYVVQAMPEGMPERFDLGEERGEW